MITAAVFFAADLMRALALPDDPPGGARAPVVEGFAVACSSSYPDGTRPAGEPVLTSFPAARLLAGRTALVVDTIVDSGWTAHAVMREARARGARDARLACLLDKPARRAAPVRPDWHAFVAPDRFLVGYGLDVGGRHRLLPHVAALDRAEEQATREHDGHAAEGHATEEQGEGAG